MLDLRYCRYTPEGVVFQKVGMAKHGFQLSGQGKQAHIPSLQKNSVLLSYAHKVFCGKSLVLLGKARKKNSALGFDTGVFKAHSNQSAGKLVAANAGVSKCDVQTLTLTLYHLSTSYFEEPVSNLCKHKWAYTHKVYSYFGLK